MTAAGETVYTNPPKPPLSIPQWRRDRMSVSIRAAIKFLQGSEWPEIMADLSRHKLLENDTVSKARIAQYVKAGVSYLMEKGSFVRVKRPRKRVRAAKPLPEILK
jgi:hypothetical protein